MISLEQHLPINPKNNRFNINYWTVRQAFVKVVADAGLSDVRLHDLRHTFMTRAAESGIAAHTLRDLLGHKTASMADRYIRRVNIPVVDATEVISGALAAIMDGPEPT